MLVTVCELFIAIGSVTLAAAVNTLGTDAVAANTAASKVDQIIIMVVMSFKCGTLRNYTCELARIVAANKGKAAFLEPEMRISPVKEPAPRINNLSIKNPKNKVGG